MEKCRAKICRYIGNRPRDWSIVKIQRCFGVG